MVPDVPLLSIRHEKGNTDSFSKGNNDGLKEFSLKCQISPLVNYRQNKTHKQTNYWDITYINIIESNSNVPC